MGLGRMPCLPISSVDRSQNGSPVTESPLVTIQIGTFYCSLMTNIEMIAIFSFRMG